MTAEVTLDEENGCFSMAIGLAIEQFAHVENAMMNLGMQFRGDLSQRDYAKAFFGVPTFRGKRQLIDEAFRTSSHWTEHASAWLEADCHLKSIAVTRNKIAHWPKVTFLAGAPGMRCALVPIFTPRAFNKAGEHVAPKGSLHVAEIDALRGHYLRAQGHVLNLHGQIEGHGRQHDRFLMTSVKRRPLHQIRDSFASLFTR